MGDEGGHQDGSERSRQQIVIPPLPKPPEPENDAGIVPDVQNSVPEDIDIDPDNRDIFTLAQVAALKLL